METDEFINFHEHFKKQAELTEYFQAHVLNTLCDIISVLYVNIVSAIFATLS